MPFVLQVDEITNLPGSEGPLKRVYLEGRIVMGTDSAELLKDRIDLVAN